MSRRAETLPLPHPRAIAESSLQGRCSFLQGRDPGRSLFTLTRVSRYGAGF